MPYKSEEEPPNDSKLANREPNYLGLVFASISGVIFLSVILVEALSNSTTPVSEQQTSPSYDDTDGLVKLENASKESVLICELCLLIETANSLSLSEKSLIDQKKKIVSDANKAISFLDKGSAKYGKYWEDPECRWGYQWFDENTGTAQRVFVVVSNKCKNPVLHYGMVKAMIGKDYIGKRQINLTNYSKGEVKLPYLPGDGFGSIIGVRCQS